MILNRLKNLDSDNELTFTKVPLKKILLKLLD